MRTDGCSAAMLWVFQTGALFDFSNWQSLESFAYSLCRSSANVIVIYDCDWAQAAPEAIECFTKMLHEAGVQVKIIEDGDQLFVYRHSKHREILRKQTSSLDGLNETVETRS